ncbi:MAG: hypothetical protein LRY71_19095 [Bacillaceae bacterium]|nr:hypothetical protein [Bacillaceae bacterium]
MWSFTKEEKLSTEQIEELKNQWFTMEEAIEELAVNGERLGESLSVEEQIRLIEIKIFLKLEASNKGRKVGRKGRPRRNL